MSLLHTLRETLQGQVKGFVQTLTSRLFCGQIFSPTPSLTGFHAPFCASRAIVYAGKNWRAKCIHGTLEEDQLNAQ